MTLDTGSRLGPYEIVGPLGAGGMGEVYKARDPRLSRSIAVKVLPVALASSPDRLRRFEAEARAASALNHPSILTVYDIGQEGPVAYIAMELVDGQTLRDLLYQGPLPVRQLLEIAAAIAEGLTVAHEAGIVHRDVKPANVMVTRQGLVKILDFGLAKTVRADGDTPNSDETTESTPGAMLGTVAYMSPEQARGGAIDFRSDQFSFGAVLYELASGRRAFRGETEADTVAAILRQEPESLAILAPHVPAPLRWIVDRCLSKAARDRYASTHDLARELRTLRDHLGEISSGPRPLIERPGRSRGVVTAVAAAAALLALGALAWRTGARRPPAVDVDFRRLTPREGTVFRAQFVPHSNTILYTASWDGGPPRSYLTLPDSSSVDRSLDADPQLPLAFTGDGAEALVLLGWARPSMSAFGPLALWPALGGKPRVVVEDGGWADVAGRSGAIATARQDGAERRLELLDGSGRPQRTLFRTTGAISYVRFSPDETTVAFIHHPSRGDDAGEVRIVAVGGGESRAVSARYQRCAGLDWDPRTGHVWFTATRENIYRTTLWESDLSGSIRAVYSFPEYFVLNDVSENGDVLLNASSGGTRLLVQEEGSASPRDLTWLGSTVVADVSPDGQSVLFMDGGTTGRSLGTWVRSLDGGDPTRIADGDAGRFSPDGKWVVTISRSVSGPTQLVVVPASGGNPRQVTASSAAFTDPSFIDGEHLLAVRTDGGQTDIWRMRTDGTEARSLGIPLCVAPDAAPSGRALLCLGAPERDTIALHPLGAGQARVLFKLSGPGALMYARWHPSEREIWAVTSDGRVLSISVSSGAVLRSESTPAAPGSNRGPLLSAALSRDGRVRAFSTSHSSSRLFLCRGL